MREWAFSFIKWSQWEFHLAKHHWKERIEDVNFKEKIAFRTSNSKEDKKVDILQSVQRLLVHKQKFPELPVITIILLWKESERRCVWTHEQVELVEAVYVQIFSSLPNMIYWVHLYSTRCITKLIHLYGWNDPSQQEIDQLLQWVD